MASFEKIMKYGVKKTYDKDEIVCIQGDAGKEMYIVLKGIFGVYINSLTDFPIKVAEIVSGHIFGEMAVLDGEPRSATVIALEKSVVLSISKDEFRELVMEDGETAFTVMQLLSKRVRGLLERLEKGGRTNDAAYFESMKAGDDKEDESDSGKITILPDGHKAYGIIKPFKDEYFLNERHEVCPVCAHGFDAKIPIFSRLAQKISHVEKDLRTVYKNFDPLWHSVWICPSCHYANYISAFSGISGEAVEELKKSRYSERIELKYGINDDTIDSVIESCYLVMQCNKMGEKDPKQDAKTWIRLYWLYGDADDVGRKLYAAERSLKGYGQIVTSMEADDRIQTYTIMAELSVFLGKFGDAQEFYGYVCTDAKKRNTMMYRQAVLRLQELKQYYSG